MFFSSVEKYILSEYRMIHQNVYRYSSPYFNGKILAVINKYQHWHGCLIITPCMHDSRPTKCNKMQIFIEFRPSLSSLHFETLFLFISNHHQRKMKWVS